MCPAHGRSWPHLLLSVFALPCLAEPGPEQLQRQRLRQQTYQQVLGTFPIGKSQVVRQKGQPKSGTEWLADSVQGLVNAACPPLEIAGLPPLEVQPFTPPLTAESRVADLGSQVNVLALDQLQRQGISKDEALQWCGVFCQDKLECGQPPGEEPSAVGAARNALNGAHKHCGHNVFAMSGYADADEFVYFGYLYLEPFQLPHTSQVYVRLVKACLTHASKHDVYHSKTHFSMFVKRKPGGLYGISDSALNAPFSECYSGASLGKLNAECLHGDGNWMHSATRLRMFEGPNVNEQSPQTGLGREAYGVGGSYSQLEQAADNRKCSASRTVGYEQLQTQHVERFLTVFRDPRAVAVSMYFYKVAGTKLAGLRHGLNASRIGAVVDRLWPTTEGGPVPADRYKRAKEILFVSDFVSRGLRRPRMPEVLRNVQDNVWREEWQRRANALIPTAVVSLPWLGHPPVDQVQVCVDASAVFYEDMVTDPVTTLAAMASLLGLRRGDAAAQAAAQDVQAGPRLPIPWLNQSGLLTGVTRPDGTAAESSLQTTRHSPYKRTSHTFNIAAQTQSDKLQKWRSFLTDEAAMAIEELIREAFPPSSPLSQRYAPTWSITAAGSAAETAA